MTPHEPDDHLSRLSTWWTMLRRAQDDGADPDRTALLGRYLGAVYRYLRAALRDADAAEELAQEFALGFLRGQFRHADPARGRFRDYLKTALIRMVNRQRAQQGAAPAPLAFDPSDPAAALPDPDSDQQFMAAWRAELLERTWASLAEARPAYHAALRLITEDPDAQAPDLAERLSAQLGSPVRADWVRQAKTRAPKKFAELLIDEVARSLETDDPDRLAQELTELDLLRYCRSALEKRRSGRRS
jgi:RNA polymerase sigma-70 factor (ECF subfamily)